MKPVRLRKAACVYGKVEGPFHPKGPAGSWCGTARENYGYFLPKNRIICQVEILYLDRCSAMNASSTKPSDAFQVRRRNAVRRGPKMRPKRGGRRGKIWKASKGVWKACNPLESHKTAKDFFGKAWSKTRDFWRSLEKGLEGAFIPPPLTLAASGLRSSWIEERSCGATQESIRTEKEK